ncbi:uncharacterized protein K460DRAFT_414631 [Cucurbitaria berberidis CBS 394.84]|uniref:DUF7730 domain-containing protein n=1 Tax=Cucurbitaria berberidis CBS 394.84 TaxID=1168544 RepID=A0A9P4GKI5_9PLEO|nr:uncharacterized protein K460DRAFT_414631 [Cucurbitaria berberidis CBS 394.84]KAF1847998.1 hypothetical protein K460DRAFT_414631 [Cucurbitaria berberidis CBS 394.84]
MATTLARRNPVKTQSGSPLLQAPYDIRCAIYSYLIPDQVHVHLREGKISVSECVPNPAVHATDPGLERKEGLPLKDAEWTREDTDTWSTRLRSTWGPHWKCEETMLQAQRDDATMYSTIEALLWTCKKMRADIKEQMIYSTSIIVTSIETIDALLQGAVSTATILCPLEDIRKLEISLRLPRTVFNAFEDQVTGSREERLAWMMPSDSDMTQAATWLRLGPALSRIKGLEELKIWLDHNDDAYWKTVNERTALSALAPLAELPNLDLTINLPRHFEDDIPIPPFVILRRLRQRHHGRNWRPDFPILEEGDCFFEDYNRQELEDLERRMWRRGCPIAFAGSPANTDRSLIRFPS